MRGSRHPQVRGNVPTRRLRYRSRGFRIRFVGNSTLPNRKKAEESDRDLFSGLIRLHILHHAVEEPIFGLGMLEELARHGYRISPGTLYPLLQGMQRKGFLRSWEELRGRPWRRVFHATPKGRR